MAQPELNNPDLGALAAALRRRLEVIGDHDLRERDPAAHLAQLQQAFESIQDIQQRIANPPPALAHFLQSCSYQKALAVLEAQGY